MEQVKEILNLIHGVELRGELVAASFIVRRVQPCKERAHLGFYYRGDDDGTRESTEWLSRKEMISQATELFTSNASFSWPKETKAFNCTNLPPQVTISVCIVLLTIAEQGTDSLMQRSTRRIGQCTFWACREPIGHSGGRPTSGTT